jgi:hypothetical protein
MNGCSTGKVADASVLATEALSSVIERLAIERSKSGIF